MPHKRVHEIRTGDLVGHYYNLLWYDFLFSKRFQKKTEINQTTQ